MLSDKACIAIYKVALDIAKNKKNHVKGNKLAGNCMAISLEMLSRLRTFVDKFPGITGSKAKASIELVVGYVEVRGIKQFYFSKEDLKIWRSEKGDPKRQQILHCWLTVNNEILDLTLAATFKENDCSFLPENVSYINSEIANKYCITYHSRLVGDNVLQELNMIQ